MVYQQLKVVTYLNCLDSALEPKGDLFSIGTILNYLMINYNYCSSETSLIAK